MRVELDDINKLRKGTVKICPQCKTSFLCNPAECWCCNLPEKLPMLDNGDCYCSDCMEAIIDKKAGTPM